LQPRAECTPAFSHQEARFRTSVFFFKKKELFDISRPDGNGMGKKISKQSVSSRSLPLGCGGLTGCANGTKGENDKVLGTDLRKSIWSIVQV
jgi:hypothetical protein